MKYKIGGKVYYVVINRLPDAIIMVHLFQLMNLTECTTRQGAESSAVMQTHADKQDKTNTKKVEK